MPGVPHEYRSPHPLTRPDWPKRHDGDSRAFNLLPYMEHPEHYPDAVLRDTQDTTLIVDKYPKSSVHLLLLPKWEPHRNLHPHDALQDEAFLAALKKDVREGVKIASARLRALMISANPDLQGANSPLHKRDFTKDLKVGIHAHPSQHHLHIHIISHDMVSNHDYSSRHYQSFNTPFFVPLKLYPLALEDVNRGTSFQNANLMKPDFECWRCGRNFGEDWRKLKVHLRDEWQTWSRLAIDDSQTRQIQS